MTNPKIQSFSRCKAILICGKNGSDKSTYATKLQQQHNAVLLSCDERMMTLLDSDLGEQHDAMTGRIQHDLFETSLAILQSGVSIIFWTKAKRDAARAFYAANGFDCELHYIDVTDAQWKRNLEKRNQAVLDGSVSAYYVDEGLVEKANTLWERPDELEITVWIQNEWEA